MPQGFWVFVTLGTGGHEMWHTMTRDQLLSEEIYPHSSLAVKGSGGRQSEENQKKKGENDQIQKYSLV